MSGSIRTWFPRGWGKIFFKSSDSSIGVTVEGACTPCPTVDFTVGGAVLGWGAFVILGVE